MYDTRFDTTFREFTEIPKFFREIEVLISEQRILCCYALLLNSRSTDGTW